MAVNSRQGVGRHHRLVVRGLPNHDRLILRLATIGLFVTQLSVVGVNTDTPVQTPDTATTTEASMEAERTSQTNNGDSYDSTTKEFVRRYFNETPILYRVAYCESRLRQFGDDGTPLRGKVNSADVGVMQINERYHLQSAKELGYDIHTLKGNLKYARHIYEEQGLQPWSASKDCWSRHLARRD